MVTRAGDYKFGPAYDNVIHKDRFYFWCYRKYKPNLIKVYFYTEKHAMVTIKKYYGDEVLKTLFLIRGKDAIANGWTFGVNSFEYKGKKCHVKKWYIPPEYQNSRSRGRTFKVELYRRGFAKRGLGKWKGTKPASIKNMLKYYYERVR